MAVFVATGQWVCCFGDVNKPATTLSLEDFATVLGALKAKVGLWGGRGLLTQVLVMLFFRRLCRVLQTVEALAGRYLAGRVLRRPARMTAAGEEARPVVRAPAPRAWPVGFAWVVRLVGHEAALLGSQLQTVLTRPEMVAFLAEVPQAVRVLRPLCRALAIPPQVLRGEPVLAWPKVVRVRAPRAPRAVVDLGRIPLPRGVMTAVRRVRIRSWGVT